MESHQQVIFGMERNRIPHATVTKWPMTHIGLLSFQLTTNAIIFSSLTETSTQILLTDSLKLLSHSPNETATYTSSEFRPIN